MKKNTFRFIFIIGIFTYSLIAIGQDTKTQPPISLQDEIKSAGFENFWDVYTLKTYVQFGSKEKQKAFYDSDQFDRLEINDSLKSYHDELSKKNFVVDKLQFSIKFSEKDLKEGKLKVVLFLPIRISSFPISPKFSGILSAISFSELNEYDCAFLTKDDKLRDCTYEESIFIDNNNGVVY